MKLDRFFTILVFFQYEYEYESSGMKVTLGKGTFGTVYAGRDLTSQRAIAIKEVEIKNPELEIFSSSYL